MYVAIYINLAHVCDYRLVHTGSYLGVSLVELVDTSKQVCTL